MANILDRYGIKEVADVTFYKITDSGDPGYPVLFLDTLKVSTIEQTAEQAEARGGKGNPPLIIWDYGKEITVTLEDALFSAKSMAIMFGNGTVRDSSTIMKTIQFKAEAAGDAEAAKAPKTWTAPNGLSYNISNARYYEADYKNAEDSSIEEVTSFKAGETYFMSFDVNITGSTIDISANSFPGTYYVTGDTYARSEITGEDEFFQFIIPKAKVQSENTITLEAEGDPSVFNMSLRVMRPASGAMMKLVKYTLNDTGTAGASAEVDDKVENFLPKAAG